MGEAVTTGAKYLLDPALLPQRSDLKGEPTGKIGMSVDIVWKTIGVELISKRVWGVGIP